MADAVEEGEGAADRVQQAAWLASPDAAEPLALARALIDTVDPLTAGSRLRHIRPDLSAGLVAACLEQATLTRLAADRYGIAPGALLTRDGLEAATRPEVAGRRGRLLAEAGAARVLDLTGGLGFDTAGFLAAGLTVTAVERDPAIAALLAHNCPGAQVVTADSVAELPALIRALGPADVVFVDPARRDPQGPRDARTARARPERDPERWSPPWSFVAQIPHDRICAKVAPGFTPPPGWQAEWVSVDRTVVECALYSWPLLGADRQAVVLSADSITEVPADEQAAPIAETLRAWLLEPDPAVVRAGALGSLARREGLTCLGDGSTWLTSDLLPDSPALRGYRVVAELTGSAKQQRRTLADHAIDRLIVKSRDVDVDPRSVLRALGVAEGGPHVLVMTRRAGRTISVVTQPAPARSH